MSRLTIGTTITIANFKLQTPEAQLTALLQNQTLLDINVGTSILYLLPPDDLQGCAVGQSVKWNSAVGISTHCYNLTNSNLIADINVTLSSDLAHILMSHNYYINPISNTITKITACSDYSESPSLYSPGYCSTSLGCNAHQYQANGKCNSLQSFNSVTQYIVSAATPTSDHIINSRTDCFTNGMYAINSDSSYSDTECAMPTICPAGTHVSIAMTPSSDRICRTIPTCPAGTYLNAAATKNAVYPSNPNVTLPFCVPCPTGYYQSSESNSDTSCTPQLEFPCSTDEYPTHSVTERDPALDPASYCKSIVPPPGYVLSKNTTVLNGKYSAPVFSPIQCPFDQYIYWYSEFENNYECLDCKHCDYQEAPCTPTSNTVCGVSPVVTEAYTLMIVMYAMYVIAIVMVYYLHFKKK